MASPPLHDCVEDVTEDICTLHWSSYEDDEPSQWITTFDDNVFVAVIEMSFNPFIAYISIPEKTMYIICVAGSMFFWMNDIDGDYNEY